MGEPGKGVGLEIDREKEREDVIPDVLLYALRTSFFFFFSVSFSL